MGIENEGKQYFKINKLLEILDMLLILWIFLYVGQIPQCFLSLLFNWLSCLWRKFCPKLETGLERQIKVKLLFLGFSVQKEMLSAFGYN